MARRNGLWLGMLIGTVTGALAALLYAPKKGEDMRGDIKDKAAHTRDKATEVWELEKEKAARAAETVSDRSKQMVSKGLDLVESGTSKVRSAIDSGVRAAEEKHRQVKNGGKRKADKKSE